MQGQSNWGQFSTDLQCLSPAQRKAYLACEKGEYGVREFAREIGRSPGTVGNHLRRARDRLGENGGAE